MMADERGTTFREVDSALCLLGCFIRENLFLPVLYAITCQREGQERCRRLRCVKG